MRDIGVSLATLAPFGGTVQDLYSFISGHRCHFLSLVVSLGGGDYLLGSFP